MPKKSKLKVYCVLGRDPLVDGEYIGDSWLIKVFESLKLAKDFIKFNRENNQIAVFSYGCRCDLYYEIKKVENGGEVK